MNTPQTSQPSPDEKASEFQTRRSRIASTYWRANLSVVGVLLSIWFVAGYVISILFIDKFNAVKIGELPLGFWFAQQGSILVFVVLVWLYAILMDLVDRRFQRDSRGE